MALQSRYNIRELGDGPTTLVFAHGFGGDQTMWEPIATHLADRHRVVLFDFIGHGMSDLSVYTSHKYGSLEGYASDVLDIVGSQAGDRPVAYIGHSVGAMIGMLAAIRAPRSFACQVMVSPSPSYADDGDYRCGLSRAQLDAMLALLDADYAAWVDAVAPLTMGAPADTHLTMDLAQRLRRNDPELMRNFARTVLGADLRPDLAKMPVPALVLQCTEDAIAPRSVGEYMVRRMPDAELALIDNIGHCPHLTNPGACETVIREYLGRRALGPAA